MYKLLKANFFRLKKEITFWIFLFISIGLGVYTIFSGLDSISLTTSLEKLTFQYLNYIGLFIAIFVSIFVGKEYANGIIRNKIIVGHKRSSIYFANLITSSLVSILCELIFGVIVFVIGVISKVPTTQTILQFVMSILDAILVIVLYCSIFNLVTMLSSEITISTTICIVLFIAFFIISLSIGYTENQPKYNRSGYTDEYGNFHLTNQELNPNYPGDDKIKIAKTIYYIIPQGQAIEIASANSEDINIFPLYSITLILIFNLIGSYFFKKKDLK